VSRTCKATHYAALAVFALWAAPARAQSLDSLYQKAKAEGSVVLYAGGPTAPWDAAAKDFSARYPGVNVSVTGGFSNVLDAKIDAQLKAGKLEVDLAVFQTLQDFVRWKQDGKLLNYKPQGFDKIERSFADSSGAYVGVQINAHVYAYNPNLVKPENVPRSALDFFAAALNFVETLRLVVEEFSILLPANKILQRLEHGEIDLEFTGLELRVDLRVKHVAEAAGDRHVHAGIARGEILCRSIPGRRRSARVENDAAFGLCLLVERVEALRPRRRRPESKHRQGRVVRCFASSRHASDPQEVGASAPTSESMQLVA